MWLSVPLLPLLHGALGFWDEILTLAPLVVGGGLLIYLYFSSRKRRAAKTAARRAEGSAPAPTVAAADSEPEAKP